tara:strand:- start:402 stop:974 length:573 start_codon:yes stop_codon:yes gene_type:complete
MYIKKFVKIFFVLLIIFFVILLIYSKFYKKNKIIILEEKNEDITYNSNIIKDVEYTTKDADGNEYLIKAKEGEIDFSNSNIIFLTNVYALIKLNNSEEVTIVSDYGKFNSQNYDTIFSKNVVIDYLDNNITGEYLDFSLERNAMLISRNVVFSDINNILKADAIELDIKTKDTKVFMYEQEKKVNIKSKN